jgi:hypothetical protein
VWCSRHGANRNGFLSSSSLSCAVLLLLPPLPPLPLPLLLLLAANPRVRTTNRAIRRSAAWQSGAIPGMWTYVASFYLPHRCTIPMTMVGQG